MRAGLLLLLALAATVVVAAGQPARVDAQEPAPAASANMFNSGDPVFAAGMARARAERDREQAAHAAPAARREREESQDAYADVTGQEAVDLAQKSFPDLLAGPPEAAGVELPNGLRISGYHDDNTATLVTATGEPYGLLDTSVPLTADPASDNPIDLDLTRSSSGELQPVDPKVALDLPETADEPTELTASDISFVPVGAEGVAAERSQDRLLYPSIDTDTDYIVQATELGAEAFWQLRSTASPTSLRLHYGLPTGASLVQGPDLGAPEGVRIVKDDKMIGRIKPVFAVDADNRPVEVVTSIDGNDLVLNVAHRNQDVHYPILVDPITEGWSGAQWDPGQAWMCGGASVSGAWWPETFGGSESYFSRSCRIDQAGWGYGLWIGALPGAPFPAGATAQSSYYAPANTYISDVAFNNWRHLNVYGTYGYTGLFADGTAPGGGWQAYQSSFYGTGATWIQQANTALRQNRVVMGLQFHTQVYSQGAITGADAVSVVLKDGAAPDSPTIVNSNPTPVDPNAADYTYDWSTGPTLALNGKDVGLGVRVLAVQRDNGTYMWGPYYAKSTKAGGGLTGDPNQACVGNQASPCPKDITSGLYVYTALTEGNNTGRTITVDAGGRYTFGRRINVLYSPYPASARYGGPDFRINTDDEADAFGAAYDRDGISDSDANALYDQLSPQDQTFLASPEEGGPSEGADAVGDPSENEAGGTQPHANEQRYALYRKNPMCMQVGGFFQFLTDTGTKVSCGSWTRSFNLDGSNFTMNQSYDITSPYGPPGGRFDFRTVIWRIIPGPRRDLRVRAFRSTDPAPPAYARSGYAVTRNYRVRRGSTYQIRYQVRARLEGVSSGQPDGVWYSTVYKSPKIYCPAVTNSQCYWIEKV